MVRAKIEAEAGEVEQYLGVVRQPGLVDTGQSHGVGEHASEGLGASEKAEKTPAADNHAVKQLWAEELGKMGLSGAAVARILRINNQGRR